MSDIESASPLRRLRAVARPCLTLLVAVLLVSAAAIPFAPLGSISPVQEASAAVAEWSPTGETGDVSLDSFTATATVGQDGHIYLITNAKTAYEIDETYTIVSQTDLSGRIGGNDGAASGITQTESGDFLVLNDDSNEVLRYTSDFSFIRSEATLSNVNEGLTIGPEGRYWVGGDGIKLYDSSWTQVDSISTTYDAELATGPDGVWSVGNSDTTAKKWDPGTLTESNSVSVDMSAASGSAIVGLARADSNWYTINSGTIIQYSAPSFGPSTSISGTVTNRDGTALRGVDVTISDSSGSVVAETTTNPSGDYSVGLGNGDYTVRVAAPDYQPVTRSVSIDGRSRTVDVTLANAFAKTVRLDDPNSTFQDPRLVVFEYTAADIRQLKGGPYSQPDVWAVSDTYPLDGGSGSADLVAGQQYAFRVVESGTGVSGGTRVVEEWPYYAQADGRAVTIDVPTTEGNETVTTTQTTDGTRVTYDGPPASEFSYELPSGFNETISWDDPREYYSTTVGENATNATASDGGELSYSGSYANGTSFNGSSIYDSAALSFGPVGGSTGGGGGGASTTLAWGLVAAAGVAAYARYGNGEVGRVVRRASDAARSLLS